MKKNFLILAATLISALSLTLFLRTAKADEKPDCDVLENNIWYKCDESNDNICSAMYYNGHLTVCRGDKVATGTEVQ